LKYRGNFDQFSTQALIIHQLTAGPMIYQLRKTFVFILICLSGISFAQDLSLGVNADLVSRYIWRGINVNDAFNIQPALTLSVSGFSFGFWGSYSLTNNLDYNIYGQELDTWLGYFCF
jgi:hypothetical protein